MKKVISALLIMTMAASVLAGCGNEKKTDTFYIGGIGPTTGSNAIYGTAVKNGAQLAVDEINEAGGINGAPIEYKFEDDQSDAEKAVNAYNTLKDWGMQILMGTVTSTPCVAVVDKTGQDNMLQITPSASTTDAINRGNVFQICFTDPNQGTKSAQYVGEHQIATKIGIIYDSSDVYSSGLEENFVKEAANQNLEIVSVEAFTADSKTDFSTQIKKAKDAGAELLFLPIYYQEASIVLAQANAIDYAPIFFGCDGMDGILSLDNFDPALAEGVLLLTPFAADAQDEATKSFVDAYKKAYKDTPNQFAADAYDAIYTIKAAIEAADCTPQMSASELCDALKPVMTTINVQGLTGGDEGLIWSESGEVNKQPKAVRIENGAYIGL